MINTSNSFKGYSKEFIERQIEYEDSGGTYTYHMCNCGRRGYRSVKCVLCWQDELNKMVKK